ncbi:MAG: hypothetical protein WCD38_07635 [Candidatus Tumulicola sp.]
MFSFPGGVPAGQLTLQAEVGGVCSDVKGNVWLTTSRYSDHETEVVEFAHGATTPFAAINGAGNNPRGCSVDPASGDLAVATYGGGTSNRNPGNVVVFPAAPKYPPVTYKVTRDAHFFFCTYDANGNLYVDGISASNDFVFYELPKGASGFVAVTLNHAISGPGGVQWDGSHVAVADGSSFQIYRFKVSNRKGTLVGTTSLENAAPLGYQFWIQGATVVAQPDNRNQFAYWNYPAGGLPTKTFAGTQFNAFTVSR